MILKALFYLLVGILGLIFYFSIQNTSIPNKHERTTIPQTKAVHRSKNRHEEENNITPD
jgi:hypothetical protein